MLPCFAVCTHTTGWELPLSADGEQQPTGSRHCHTNWEADVRLVHADLRSSIRPFHQHRVLMSSSRLDLHILACCSGRPTCDRTLATVGWVMHRINAAIIQEVVKQKIRFWSSNSMFELLPVHFFLSVLNKYTMNFNDRQTRNMQNIRLYLQRMTK